MSKTAKHLLSCRGHHLAATPRRSHGKESDDENHGGTDDDRYAVNTTQSRGRDDDEASKGHDGSDQDDEALAGGHLLVRRRHGETCPRSRRGPRCLHHSIPLKAGSAAVCEVTSACSTPRLDDFELG